MKIAVANQKGGVGKSTIANLMAQKLKLPIKNEDPFQDPFIYTDAEKYRSGESYVLDAGGFVGKELERELKEVDAVIVPLQASPRDFVPTLNFLEWLLKFYDGRVLIVANRANKEEAEEVKEAMINGLEQIDGIRADVRFSYLPNLKSIQSWDLERKRWMDFLTGWNRSQKKAAEYIDDFCEAMKEWIEEDINS